MTKAPIPESVLDYYIVTRAERAFYGCSRPPEGPFTEHNDGEEYQAELAAEKKPNRGSSR